MKGIRALTCALALLAGAGCNPERSAERAADATTSQDTPSQKETSEGGSYTSLENCPLVESKPDEAGYSLRRCVGIGADLLLIESDGRQSIHVAPAGAEPVPLRLPEFAGNGGFSTLGPRAEWRGGNVIVRYNVAEDPARPEVDTSYLIVARTQPEPCVIAVVYPDSAQNETARARADAGGECIERGATSSSRDVAHARLTLDPEGLRVFFAPAGSARPIPFGTDGAEVMRMLRTLLNDPTEEGTNDCELAFATWPGGLTVTFSNSRFVGWTTRTPGTTLQTAGGVGIGSTRRELESVHNATIRTSSIGIEFSAGALSGVLESAQPDARITHMWAGETCIAR